MRGEIPSRVRHVSPIVHPGWCLYALRPLLCPPPPRSTSAPLHPLCPGRRPICEECRRADKHSERSRGNEESPGHRSPMNAEAEGECEGRKLGWWGTGRSVCISEWGMRLWGSLGQVERGFRCVRSWMFSCSSGQRVRSGKDSHTHETPAAGGEGEWPCLGSTL